MPTPIPHPADANSTLSSMEAFVRLVWILREQCPWDMKQTHESISHLLIEEAYETLEAIKDGDDAELSKELGDLLLHVVMHCVMAEQRNVFSFKTVIDQEFAKLVNRHPHIFADDPADNEEKVLQNWERLKMKEGRESTLDGVPRSLPASLRAQRVQEKAANVGFDWNDKHNVWAKVEEELAELKVELESGNSTTKKSELGDVLFAIINAARHEGIVAEDALHETTNRFIGRFQYIEQQATKNGKTLAEMELEEMDYYWNEAKQLER